MAVVGGDGGGGGGRCRASRSLFLFFCFFFPYDVAFAGFGLSRAVFLLFLGCLGLDSGFEFEFEFEFDLDLDTYFSAYFSSSRTFLYGKRYLTVTWRMNSILRNAQKREGSSIVPCPLLNARTGTGRLAGCLHAMPCLLLCLFCFLFSVFVFCFFVSVFRFLLLAFCSRRIATTRSPAGGYPCAADDAMRGADPCVSDYFSESDFSGAEYFYILFSFFSKKEKRPGVKDCGRKSNERRKRKTPLK